jgi:hypothetical protein
MKRTSLPDWIKIKNGVLLTGISEYHFGIMFWEMLRHASRHVGVKNFGTITSGSEKDAPHSKGSMHYKYLAMDIRIRDLEVSGEYRPFSPRWWGAMCSWVTTLAVTFPHYVFVLEKTHLHVQIGYDNIVGEPRFQAVPNLYINKNV